MPRGDLDPNSPTALLQQRLTSQGLPLTAENMRRLLVANAYGGGEVPGVRNYDPTSDPGVGQQGNVAGKIEKAPRGARLPTPPIPPGAGGGYGDVGESGSFDKRGAPNPALVSSADAGVQDATNNKTDPTAPEQTSAQPTDGDSALDLSNIGAIIAAGGGAGLGWGLTGRGGGAVRPEFMGNQPMDTTGRVIDVPPPAVTGDRYALLPDMSAGGPPTSPMEMAMQRALQPPVGAIAGPGASVPVDVPPYVSDPMSLIQQGRQLPPGVTPADIARAGSPDLGVDPAASRVGVHDMPPMRGAPLKIDPTTGNLRGSPFAASRTGTEALIRAGKAIPKSGLTGAGRMFLK